MNKIVLSSIVAAGLATTVSHAGAAVTLVSSDLGNVTGYTAAGLTLVQNFDTAAGLSGNYQLVTGSSGSQYQEPLGDSTQYLSIPQTSAAGVTVGSAPFTATYTLGQTATTLGFYWGSPDGYNNIVTFYNGASVVGTYSPAAPLVFNGSNGNSTYVVLNAGGNFDSVAFTTQNIAFEIDNIALGVPEPGEWAMMLAGLGMVSVIARRRKAAR